MKSKTEFKKLLSLEEAKSLLEEQKHEDISRALDYYRDLAPSHVYFDHLLEIFSSDSDSDSEDDINPKSIFENEAYIKCMQALISFEQFLELKKPVQPSVNNNSNMEPETDLMWRLHIDGIHQVYGPSAYSQGGSASDNEFSTENNTYLLNINTASKFLNEKFSGDKKMTIAIYQELYEKVMAGTTVLAEEKKCFRRQMVITRTGHFNHVDQDRYEKVKLNKKNGPSEYLDDTANFNAKRFFSEGIQGFYYSSSDTIRNQLIASFETYNQAISAENLTDEAKIIQIATLYQKLESTHGYRDGNGRTNRLLLNSLLVSQNLSQTILSDPACAHYLNIQSLVKEIKKGQEKFVMIGSLSPDNWKENNKKIIEWEKHNGITVEYSLEHGEALQNLWSKIVKLQKIAEELKKADLEIKKHELPIPALHSSLQNRIKQSSEKVGEMLKIAEKDLRAYNKVFASYHEASEVKYLRQRAITNYFPNFDTAMSSKENSPVKNQVNESGLFHSNNKQEPFHDKTNVKTKSSQRLSS